MSWNFNSIWLFLPFYFRFCFHTIEMCMDSLFKYHYFRLSSFLWQPNWFFEFKTVSSKERWYFALNATGWKKKLCKSKILFQNCLETPTHSKFTSTYYKKIFSFELLLNIANPVMHHKLMRHPHSAFKPNKTRNNEIKLYSYRLRNPWI